MKLRDATTIKTNFESADFWLIRRGSRSQCGKPTRAFYKEHIGIKVNRIDLLLPDYLYYALMHVHQSKYWEPIATGALSLVNIRIKDVQLIELSPT